MSRLRLGVILLAILLLDCSMTYGYVISVEFDTDQLECADNPGLSKCTSGGSPSAIGNGNSENKNSNNNGGGGRGGGGSASGTGDNRKPKLVPPRIKNPLSFDDDAVDWVEEGITPKNAKIRKT